MRRAGLVLLLLSFQGEFQTDYPLLFAGVILASLPVVVAYVFLQRTPLDISGTRRAHLSRGPSDE